jgi:hypothetical protein
MQGTWKQFKEFVEAQLRAQGVGEDVPIDWIDFSGYALADGEVEARVGREGLVIS